MEEISAIEECQGDIKNLAEKIERLEKLLNHTHQCLESQCQSSEPINRLTLKNFIGCKTYKTKTECKDCTDLEGCTLIPDGKCFSKKS